jgi:hypothetical protein
LKRLLEESEITGWSTFPVEVFGRCSLLRIFHRISGVDDAVTILSTHAKTKIKATRRLLIWVQLGAILYAPCGKYPQYRQKSPLIYLILENIHNVEDMERESNAS